MVSLIGIIAGIAIVLAVIVTAVVVGVCLVLARVTKPGGRGPSQYGQNGQYGQYGAPGAPGAPPAIRRPPGSKHRAGPRAPVGSRHANR
jgi:hypothetical protein